MKKFVLVFLILGYFIIIKNLAGTKPLVLTKENSPPKVIPPAVLKLTWGEFKNLGADFLFIKSLVYQEAEAISKFSEQEWNYVYSVLEASRVLDPYFKDPYWLVQAFFPWEAESPEKAIAFLKKGLSYRTWDWTLPYYIGFNYFFFLRDYAQASKYLFEAAKISDNPFIATLAAQIAYKGGKTETAIAFLSDMYSKVVSEEAKKSIKKRLDALQGVLILEKAVERYKMMFGHLPHTLSELIDKGIIKEIPQNPYHIPYYLKDGKVLF